MATRAGSKGWHVEVDHPGGNTIKPTIVGTPRRLPRLNGLPRVEVPVERNDRKWQSSDYEGAGMRLYYNGRRQECEEIVNIRTVEDRGREMNVLVGRDGSELRERATETFRDEPAHSAASTVVTNNTTYTGNFDAPASAVTTGVDMQDPTTTAEFNAVLEAGDPAATDPWEVSSDKITRFQTCFTVEGEDTTSESGTSFLDASRFSDGTAEEFDGNGQQVTYDFTPQYDIPKEDMEVHLRWESNNAPELEMTLNGQTWTILSGGGTISSVQWREVIGNPAGGTTPTFGSDFSANTTYTVQIDSVSSGGSSARADIDVVAPADGGGSRFTANYTFDNSTDGNGNLDGPEFYPDQLDIPFATASAVRSVTAADVTVTMNDTTGSQALALSNDGGVNYTTSANSSTLDHSFASLGPSVKFKVTLSRYGTRTTATPATGFNAQDLQDYDLNADLDDTPLLGDQYYDDNIEDILNDIAEYGNFVWEFTRDSNGNPVIEWTTPGQRTTDLDVPTRGFEVKKRLEDQYYKATIKGASKFQAEERFTSDHGTAVDLDQDDLVVGSEAVYDGSGTGFTRDVDYTMDWGDGKITVLANGDMSDSTQYIVDYRYQPSATFTSDNAPGSPTELVREAPAATSDRECGQIAINIVAETENPLFEVAVRLDRLDPGQHLVDDIALEGVPMGDDRATIRDIVHTPNEVKLLLGTRRSVDEILTRYQQRLRQTARKV